MKHTIKGLKHNIPIITAIFFIFIFLILASQSNALTYRVAVLTVPVGAGLYLLSNYKFKNKLGVISIDSTKHLHISNIILLSAAAIVSPASKFYTPVVYFFLISVIFGLLIFIVIIEKDYILALGETILLSILIRGAVFFQFPSIPGIDAPINHVPAIISTINEGRYISSVYPYAFPVSHFRVAIGEIITSAGLKESMYLWLFFPQAIGVFLVYVFVRRLWNKNRAIFATMFVAVISFNITYGFRRIPQATTVTLLPLLLFTIFYVSDRNSILSIILFSTIVLAHNAPPWIILFFFVSILALDYILTKLLLDVPIKISNTILIILSLGIIKIGYIQVSGYYYNIGRIIKTILFLFGKYQGEGVPTTSSVSGYEFALLRFSSIHLLITAILVFIFLIYMEKIFRKGVDRGVKCEMIWYVPVIFLWAIAGFLLVSDAPGNTKIFGPLGILLAPLIYDFILGITRSQRQKIRVAIMIILFVSVAFVGITHPRSTVDSLNRPNQNAIGHNEIAALGFTNQMPKSTTVGVYLPVHRYEWRTNVDLILVGEDERSDYYFLKHKLNKSETKIYTNGDINLTT